MSDAPGRPSITVILPCLDEQGAVERVVREALAGLAASGRQGEVLVVDNGSSDHSADLALRAGARVVHEPVKGYGAALRRGIAEARGDIAVMADADMTYDLGRLGELVAKVDAGADLVLASRLVGATGETMPPLHRLVGTPVLSFLVRRLSGGMAVSDSQSGYRAFDLEKVRGLRLVTSGMEFASEMLVRAAAEGLRVEEVAIPYRARVGESKLNTFDDGFRHLKLVALLGPQTVLLWPAVLMGIVGAVLTVASLVSPAGIQVGGGRWQPVFFAPILLVLATMLGVAYQVVSAFDPLRPARTPSEHSRSRLRLVRGGFVLASMGVSVDVGLFFRWSMAGEQWDRALALAGLAQALILSGATVMASAFIYWLVHRQSEYGTRR